MCVYCTAMDGAEGVQLSRALLIRLSPQLTMAASSSSSLTALRTLRTLQSRWPADPLRPTLQFSAALESALGRIEQQGNLTRSQQEQKAVEMGNALQRLLNDEALNRVSLPLLRRRCIPKLTSRANSTHFHQEHCRHLRFQNITTESKKVSRKPPGGKSSNRPAGGADSSSGGEECSEYISVYIRYQVRRQRPPERTLGSAILGIERRRLRGPELVRRQQRARFSQRIHYMLTTLLYDHDDDDDDEYDGSNRSLSLSLSVSLSIFDFGADSITADANGCAGHADDDGGRGPHKTHTEPE